MRQPCAKRALAADPDHSTNFSELCWNYASWRALTKALLRLTSGEEDSAHNRDSNGPEHGGIPAPGVARGRNNAGGNWRRAARSEGPAESSASLQEGRLLGPPPPRPDWHGRRDRRGLQRHRRAEPGP